jgi:hypothetical protein
MVILRKFAIALAAVVAVSVRAEESEYDDPDDLDSEEEVGGGDTEAMLMEQATKDFEAMDLDQDGKLSVKDLEEYLNDPSMAAEVKDFIEKADTDKDGFVSMEEYTAFVTAVIADYEAHGDQDEHEHDNPGDDLDDLDDEEL